MVLLLDGSPTETTAATLTLAEEVTALMTTEGLPEKDALKRVAKSRGLGKSEAYREWQRTR
jgi:16S rRNA (cytidine1402-2'-O)-methyltransferase